MICSVVSSKRSSKRLDEPALPGEIIPLESMWVWRVPARDTFNRSFQVEEASLLQQRGQLATEAAEAAVLVQDHAPPGLREGTDDGIDVERHDGTGVDDLDVQAALLHRG